MDYLFKDIKKTKDMVSGAYLKLKSHLYYDKTLVFAKKHLANFESNRVDFEHKIQTISENLSSQNKKYFDSLVSQIGFKVLPKKFVSQNEEQGNVVIGSIDHNQKISKINFFIDMPIELMVLDFLWTLLIGKLTSEHPEKLEYAAATKFKPSLFNKNEDLFEGIDFSSNRAFEPYFNLYRRWRNDAFKCIEKEHEKNDTILMCLDLKSFYYSVEFSFDKIPQYFNNDERLETFDFLTSIVEEIYHHYTKIIVNYKMGIKNHDNASIFPIGVISAYVLRELYLTDLDCQITTKLSPKYYNRYVDDILIVINYDEDEKPDLVDHIVNKYLVSTGLVLPLKHDLKFINYNNIRIQTSKINCFYFPKGQQAILLDLYAKVIGLNSSEANLLPDTDILSVPFIQKAYNIDNLDISNKIRDLGFLKTNNYSASIFINSLLKLIKNTNADNHNMSEYFSQVEEFYQGSHSIEYSNSWRSIFELYLLCNDKHRANVFYKKIKDEINKIDFTKLSEDEVFEKTKDTILRKLKSNLKEKLDITISLTCALDYSFSRKKDIDALARSFRQSNMLNHAMVSFPLLNYSSAEDVALTDYSIHSLFDNGLKSLELDSFKLTWSPRYINATEFYIYGFLYRIDKEDKKFDPDNIYNKYINYNHINNYEKSKVEYVPHVDLLYDELRVRGTFNPNPKIALVNTAISKQDAIDGLLEPKLTVAFKARLFKILNTAKEEKVDILVFPEFYFPISWLNDISKFAISNDITIITGLQYIAIKDQAYNIVCMVMPTSEFSRFKSGIIQFREKNFYAPEEIIQLSKHGYKCINPKTPRYFIVDNGNYAYSTILCYEFTDIQSRAQMKSKIEVLFVPQLNQDTNYFSAIVESSARDLHCFVVQANTSIYGDSRITAPYKTTEKNILQVKGGCTDIVMMNKIDIIELKRERVKYTSDLNRISAECFKCATSSKRRDSRKCDNCKKGEIIKGKIKGTPPNFDF